MDVDPGDTFLTERQAEVLASRHRGETQTEIADRFDTSVANVSAIERSARDNVARARRTLTLARLLRAAVRFEVADGTDLREVVDRIYAAGDDADIRVAHSEPALVTRLATHLEDHLADRRLTDPVEVGLTAEGEVVTHPSAVVGDETEASRSDAGV